MYDHILVPIAADHNPATGAALDVARKLLSAGGRITALTVVEAMPGYILSQLPEGQIERTKAEVAAELAADLGGATDVNPVVTEGHSARSILDYAEEHEVNLIVIASHRPDITDYFLGSTAARVVRHAKCAVHVLR